MRWFTVIVWFSNTGNRFDRPFIDGVKATDRESALANARWNWEGAVVSVMDRPNV